MKAYKLASGILVESLGKFYLLDALDWDAFVNDDALYRKTLARIESLDPINDAERRLAEGLEAPIQGQELWASGVTYLRSKEGRQEESGQSGSADFYGRVYEAERPELFFKATRQRIVGHGGKVRIRRDSTWNVPEPELVLMLSSSGKIVGYTIGNDMSSRSIEGENPLYLPQAKTYDGCAALGPCILLTETPLASDARISLHIDRAGRREFSGVIAIDQIRRRFEDLAEFLFRECSFPNGALLMTGTGIVPDGGFTLMADDAISISIDGIGVLANTVAVNS